jgi:hypothetical protein
MTVHHTGDGKQHWFFQVKIHCQFMMKQILLAAIDYTLSVIAAIAIIRS